MNDSGSATKITAPTLQKIQNARQQVGELNELIATSGMNAFHAGETAERERIIKLLKPLADHLTTAEHPAAANLVAGIIKLINGEQT